MQEVDKNAELVLCVASDIFDFEQDHALSQALQNKSQTKKLFYVNNELIDEEVDYWLSEAVFRPRGDVETDPNWKQIIPYVSLIRDDGALLFYTRTKKGGEKRLVNKFSCGFGGHVNPVDGVSPNRAFLQKEAIRELLEETALQVQDGKGDEISPLELPRHLQMAGLIYDNTTDVGQVHLGFHYVLFVGKNFQIEPSAECESFVWRYSDRAADSGSHADRLEPWTIAVQDRLFQITGKELKDDAVRANK